MDILDAQLQDLKPNEKDSAGRSYNKVDTKLYSVFCCALKKLSHDFDFSFLKKTKTTVARCLSGVSSL